MPPEKPANRLSGLDAIRGVAVALVVLEHGPSLGIPLQRFLDDQIDLGRIGVIAFFLVSGFVITMSLERTRSLAEFWYHRAFRLLPMYWCSLLAATGLLCCLPQIAHGVPYFNRLPGTMIANALMLEDFLRKPEALGSYWTLSFELVFYVIASLLAHFRRLRDLDALLLGCSGLYLLNACGLFSFYAVTFFHLPFFFGTFFVGASFYRAWNGEQPYRRFLALIAVFCATSVLAWYRSSFVDHLSTTSMNVPPLPYIVGSALGYATFFGIWALRDRGQFKGLIWLGQISYSVYLVHGIMLVPAGLIPDWSIWFLLLVVTPAVSWLSFRYIEKPAYQFSKRSRSGATHSSTSPAPSQSPLRG
jgi:peptidoglycan/LPS O-acetylase OafA/YrhL